MFLLRIVFLALCLSGCAGNQRCDPRLDTDILSTINCSAISGYDSSVGQAQNQLNTARQDKARLISQLESLQAEQTQLEQSIRENDAELLASETELAAIKKRVANAKGKNNQLNRDKSRITNENQKIALLRSGSEEQKRKLADKKKEVETLKRVVERIL
jgi:chromosome segregation ATPase